MESRNSAQRGNEKKEPKEKRGDGGSEEATRQISADEKKYGKTKRQRKAV